MEQKRKLIRKIAVFLVIAIIFGSVGKYNYKRAEASSVYEFPPYMGEKDGSMWVSTDKLNGKKGDIITLTFTYTGTRAVNAIDFVINFDNSLLEVCNYKPVDRICSNLDYNAGNGYFIMSTLGYDEYYIHKGERFLSMQFKCLKDIDKKSIIKFTDVGFTFIDNCNPDFYIFEEGYSVNLTPEFGMEVTADKISNIKKDDIITLIFTYTGTTDVDAGMEGAIDYDEELFIVCDCKVINRLSTNEHCFRPYDSSFGFSLPCFVNGVETDENYIRKDEQFMEMKLQCIKDIKQESEICFFYPNFIYRDETGINEYAPEDYYYSVKLSLYGTSEPAPTATPFSTSSPSPAPTIPTGSAILPNCKHLFNDYDYTSPVKDSPVILYGNGINKKIDGNVVNNKQFTAYTDILPSYNYTLNSRGVVKPSSGKVIAGITTSSTKPVVSKNKIVDRDAAKIAKASIKSGQVTVTAAGKEKGLVYLWIIDTGKNGTYECCPVNVLMAPKKLEVQNTSGSKLKNPSISQGGSLDVCVAGIAPGGTTTDDCTYTATVADASQSYVKVTPVQGKNGQFKITAIGLKNNKNTKVSITFTCNENKKKVKLAATIKK